MKIFNKADENDVKEADKNYFSGEVIEDPNISKKLQIQRDEKTKQ